jgi:hypothetical protein
VLVLAYSSHSLAFALGFACSSLCLMASALGGGGVPVFGGVVLVLVVLACSLF